MSDIIYLWSFLLVFFMAGADSKIQKNKSKYEGRIYKSVKCGNFEVIKYRRGDDVSIKFIDTGNVINATMQRIRSGSVKDRSIPSVYGVGYLGDDIKPYANSRTEKCYTTWKGIIQRCYTDSFKDYIDCKVSDEWKSFSRFYFWWDEQVGDKNPDDYQVDKDIKIKGNKIYSKETCLLVRTKNNISDCVSRKRLSIIKSEVEGMESEIEHIFDSSKTLQRLLGILSESEAQELADKLNGVKC